MSDVEKAYLGPNMFVTGNYIALETILGAKADNILLWPTSAYDSGME
jgi:hypothetical protein